MDASSAATTGWDPVTPWDSGEGVGGWMDRLGQFWERARAGERGARAVVYFVFVFVFVLNRREFMMMNDV